MSVYYSGIKVSLLLFVCALVILILLVLPPFVSIEWRFIIMTAFSSVCHQIPERSFHIADVSLAVCHRCAGIYAGLPPAMLAIMITNGWRIGKNVWAILLFSSVLIVGFDWGLSAAGFWENTMYSRVTTGLLFGLSAGAYLVLVVTSNQNSKTIEITKSNFVL